MATIATRAATTTSDSDSSAMLNHALAGHDLEKVKDLVREECIDFPPFFVALRYRFWDAVFLFIDICPSGLQRQQQESERFDFDESMRKGYYPLHMAAQNGAPSHLLRRMIEACPESPFFKDKFGRIPLMTALSMSALYEGRGEDEELHETIEALLEASPDTIKMKDHDGDMPLHYACIYCTLRVIELLASKFIEAISVVNNNGTLPLHTVLKCFKDDTVESKVEMISFLAKAFPESLVIPDDRGRLAIHVAYDNSHDNDVVQCIASLSDSSSSLSSILATQNPMNGKTALHYAAHHKSMRIRIDTPCRPLPRAGDAVRRAARSRALMISNHYERIRDCMMFQFLARKSPESLRVTDNDGRLPLHLCCTDRRTKVALVHYPEAASQPDKDGNLPVHLVHDNAKVSKLLIDAYPEGLGAANNRGEMPVHVVVQAAVQNCTTQKEVKRSIDVLKAMNLKDPSCLRRKCSNGRSPIFYALDGHDQCCFRDVLDFLLERDPGCINALDNDLCNPLHHLAKKRTKTDCDDVFRLLLELDRASAFNRHGNLPLFYAAENHSLDTVYMLVGHTPELFACWNGRSDPKNICQSNKDCPVSIFSGSSYGCLV